MSSSKPKRHAESRHLEITTGGWWYLALTVALGVVAVVSRNNVLYVMESLLLSGLVLSGIFSEWTINRMAVSWIPRGSFAQKQVTDEISIRNVSRLPAFAVEIGYWRDGRFERHSFVPMLPGLTELKVKSDKIYSERGAIQWAGIAIATSSPFGFARKTRIIKKSGARFVWPALAKSRELSAFNGAQEISDGEVRDWADGDAVVDIVWSKSVVRTVPVVRVRRYGQDSAEFTVDLREGSSRALEQELSVIATKLSGPQAQVPSLRVLCTKGKYTVRGRIRVLNELACLKAEAAA